MQNKEAIFNELLKDNHASIYRICMAYLYDRSHADDLYQEILYNIWKSLDSYKGNAQLSTWIYRVAVNTAISYNIKQKKQQHAALPDTLNIAAEERNTQEEAQLKRLRRCIQQLEAQDRLIISLVLEDKSYKEIAEITGSNTNNVGVKINRIKARLLKLMENTAEHEL